MVEQYDAYGTCPKCGTFWLVPVGRLWKVESQDDRCDCGEPVMNFLEIYTEPNYPDEPYHEDYADDYDGG